MKIPFPDVDMTCIIHIRICKMPIGLNALCKTKILSDLCSNLEFGTPMWVTWTADKTYVIVIKDRSYY